LGADGIVSKVGGKDWLADDRVFVVDMAFSVVTKGVNSHWAMAKIWQTKLI
jgi:hypothetical protein